MKVREWSLRLLTVALAAGACLAQSPERSKYYKLDFVLKEVEGGKVLNSRSYSITASTEASSPHTSIRTGSKVPVMTGGGGQFTYLDVGVSIDCSLLKVDQNDLSLTVAADISNIFQEPAAPAGSNPVIRDNKWSSNVIVPIRKPTVIFSSDDATSKRQMQLELTASPI